MTERFRVRRGQQWGGLW